MELGSLPTHRRRRRLSRVLAVAVTAAGVIGLAVPAAGANAAPQQIGAAPRVPAGAVRLADPDSSSVVHLDVQLAPRDPAALAAFVTSVSTPGNVGYHHYLAKGQFATVFGPTTASVDAVRKQLASDGLTVDALSPDALTLPVTTTIGQAAQAFGIGFHGYTLPGGRHAYANTVAPSLPASVAHLVASVVGLDDLALPAPNHTPLRAKAAAPGAAQVRPNNALRPRSSAPTTCSEVRNLFPSLVDGQDYWEPNSLSTQAAYNTGQLYGQYGNTGSGVTVGLFELENYSDADIAAYQDCYQTAVPVTRAPVDGGPHLNPDPNEDIGVESALDIESIAGVAPGSSITVYQGPDASSLSADPAGPQNVLDVYERMVNDDSAQVLSTSWGLCELDSSTSLISAESTVFAQAAAQGQTVLAASGDDGSTDCYRDTDSSGRPSQNANAVAVDDPAAQPYVTAVGGTTMRNNGAGSVNLTAWNEPANSQLGTSASATGGGVSSVFSLSGDGNYQTGVQGAGYANTCGAPAGATCRQVPDVSAIGDLQTGYLVAIGQDTEGDQYWGVAGGTSLSAPVWAAITALADSSNSCAANGSVGFANPVLYRNPAALADVTTGNNVLSGTGYTGNLYQASVGYDLTTGLGSPRAPQVVEALCGGGAATAGSSFVPVTSTRLLDTRNGPGAIGPNSQIPLQVTGASGVPASGVTAVVLNVTATDATQDSFLTIYPDGTARPLASNVNFSAGQTIPNLVTVPVGADGKVDIYNLNGSVDVIADLFGYYTTGGSGYKFHASTPHRMVDTRVGTGVGPGQPAPIGPDQTFGLPLSDVNGPGNAGALTNAAALMLNVTVTGPTQSGYVTVYPSGVDRPLSSNLNFPAGATIPNSVITPVNGTGIDFYNFAGSTSLIVDVFGYFASS
jgi:subtilase family serine protease